MLALPARRLTTAPTKMSVARVWVHHLHLGCAKVLKEEILNRHVALWRLSLDQQHVALVKHIKPRNEVVEAVDYFLCVVVLAARSDTFSGHAQEIQRHAALPRDNLARQHVDPCRRDRQPRQAWINCADEFMLCMARHFYLFNFENSTMAGLSWREDGWWTGFFF